MTDVYQFSAGLRRAGVLWYNLIAISCNKICLQWKEVFMARPTVDFAARLHAQGFRLTPQRQMILEAIYQVDDHVTPEEVFKAVHCQNPAVSRATIYRTLDFLCELRLIHAMYWGRQMYYEIADGQPHHHLRRPSRTDRPERPGAVPGARRPPAR